MEKETKNQPRDTFLSYSPLARKWLLEKTLTSKGSSFHLFPHPAKALSDSKDDPL